MPVRSRPLRPALLALATLLATPAFALDPAVPFRDYELDRWGVENGLPQITVMSIVQDHAGYLWVGTQNGIARFDGLDFETYDRASTGVDTTLAIGGLVDRDGHIWFGTPRGALHIAGGKVTEVRAAADLLSVRGLAERPDGQLLFATERGIHTLGDGRLVPLWTVGTPTWALHVDGATTWAGAMGAVWRVTDGKATALRLPRSDARVTHFAQRGSELWLGTSHGVYTLDPVSERVRTVLPELALDLVESLAMNDDGNAWIGTESRLVRVRPDDSTEVVGAEDLAGRPWVLAIFEDDEGDLWFGTRRESLYRVRNSPTVVRGERDGLTDPFVWSLLPEGDGLLVGTNSNLMRLGADQRFRELVPGARLPNPSVYDLARDPDGTLWLGTRAGVALWRDGRLTRLPALAALDDKQITAMRRVGPGDWWIASMDGLFRYRAGLLEPVIAPAGSAATRIRSLFVLGPDHLLVGSEAGVHEVRDRDVTRPAWAEPLAGAFVSRITEVQPGLLAFATLDSGLGLLRDERLMMLGEEHGLPTRNAWTLDVIGAHLYLGSIVGVSRIPLANLPDPRGPAPRQVGSQVVAESTGRVRTLQRFACCNGGAAARSAVVGRYLYYPSTNGVVRIDTTAIPPVPPAPRAVIEMLRNANTTRRTDGPLAIEGASRDAAIEYTGLSLIESHAIEFRYQLEGYDGDWVEAGNRRVAYYTHLPPGEYRFRLQARHPLGDWSADAVPFALSVVPAWHERGLVRIAALLVLLLLAIMLWRLRVDELRSRQRVLERAVAERTRELARANERLRGANQALALESQTDPLTGLYNRRFVMESSHARNGARASDRGALLLLDLDHFKEVNDQHGHASGDTVLRQLAHLLTDTLRTGDLVTRWGGEEFLMLLPGVELPRAIELAERLRAAVASHGFATVDGKPLRLTCSIGLAANPPRVGLEDGFQLALDLADAGLYRAKREGRDRVWALDLLHDPAAGDAVHLSSSIDALVAMGHAAWRAPGG
jgi:diguanylate cyclase (GGDEF)-like protein